MAAPFLNSREFVSQPFILSPRFADCCDQRHDRLCLSHHDFVIRPRAPSSVQTSVPQRVRVLTYIGDPCHIQPFPPPA